MGNSGSINIIKQDGIYQVNVKDYPDYPIVYLRLCKDEDTNKYCMAEECVIDKKDKYLKRQIIVVGFRVKEEINEQVFYLSSGYNSVKTLETFLNLKLTVPESKEDQDLGLQLWIPFSGFGYDKSTVNTKIDLFEQIKLLKDNFNCSIENKKDCMYGRFGRYKPNLMQISYCLGGKFWENNIDKFNKFNILKMPTLFDFIKNIDCYTTSSSKKNIIECFEYLNDYIGYALPQNYSIHYIKEKEKAMLKYDKEKWFNKNIKYDLRILKILKNAGILNYGYLRIDNEYINSPLPLEQSFYAYNNWELYFLFLGRIYKRNIELYNSQIKPIIESQQIVIKGGEKEKEEEKKEYTYRKGTFENPYIKRDDALIGEYYLRGEKPVQKRK
jgi:hypothetical protein